MTEKQTAPTSEKEESCTGTIYRTLGGAGEKIKDALSGVSQKASDMNAKIQEAAIEAQLSQEKNQSGGLLFSRISDLANTIIAKELELAKLKLKQMLKDFAIGGVMIVGALVMAFFMLNTLLFAGAAGFAVIWLPEMKALCFGALIISGILLLFILVMLLLGIISIKRAKKVSPSPTSGLKALISVVKKGITK